MSNENPTTPATRPSLFRNWLNMTGLVIATGGLFSFLLLFVIDMMAHVSNPYLGILTYLVAPAFLILGLVMIFVGALRQRRKLGSGALPRFVVDFSQPRDRRVMGFFALGMVVFLLLSAIGSYQTYHFTESVQFCGEACHTVMEPELVTYQQGSHARVACVECHIGSGATWFVKSKLSGTYQVYATAFDKFPRPIPTPIKNLRPAQETCEQCHWPQKFSGNLERTYAYFLGDETNTPFTVRMLMKVGGGNPAHGPVGGIHWHMNVANKVEYFTPDESRQTIPWVRVTDTNGVVTEYRAPRFTNTVVEADIRVMDCIDCHTRPAHRYQTPNDAVNLAMNLGRIDASLPWIKTNALFALTRTYTNRVEAQQTIARLIEERYPGNPKAAQATETIQDIYRRNFFPEMKASYEAYPDNIGHMEWPGCFRCHDGKHKTADGKKMITSNDCNSCHTILSQGAGAELDQLTPAGQPFKHPGDEVDGLCNDCHTGGL